MVEFITKQAKNQVKLIEISLNRLCYISCYRNLVADTTDISILVVHDSILAVMNAESLERALGMLLQQGKDVVRATTRAMNGVGIIIYVNKIRLILW